MGIDLENFLKKIPSIYTCLHLNLIGHFNIFSNILMIKSTPFYFKRERVSPYLLLDLDKI